MSETEIEEMFDVADTDRDGIIGYPEFMGRTEKTTANHILEKIMIMITRVHGENKEKIIFWLQWKRS